MKSRYLIELVEQLFVLILVVIIMHTEAGQEKVDRILSATAGFQYFAFTEGVTCNAAQKPFNPASLLEVQEIVKVALWKKQTLKAIGNLHSGTDIICTDGIPVTMKNFDHFRYDQKTALATVGAGATMGFFLEQLHQQNRSLYGIPTYSDITVGGAIATGVHGSSFRFPATLSEQVVGVVVVDGMGNVRTITNRETLRAFRAHLGLLGIVCEIVFSTIPQYKLHIRHYPEPDSVLRNGQEIISLATSNERFQFFWFPTSKSVVMSVGNRVPLDTKGNCQTYFIPEGPRATTQPLSEAFERMQEGMDHLGYFAIQSLAKLSLYQKVPGRNPVFTENGNNLCEPAIGYSHRMVANRCVECPWNNGNASVFQFEFAAIIPLSELQGALNTLRAILEEYPTEFPLTGIYFRFLPASEGLLTVNSDQPSVAIEWVLVPRKDRYNKPMLGLPSTQAMVQALITKHGGRSHWGKNGPLYTHQELLLQRYPHLPTFIRWMQEFDPHGVFLNDFGRRLRFGSRKRSVDRYATHCALVDGCICRTDKDCGDGSPGSYLCDTLQNYRVCKENAGEYDVFRERIVRKFVGSLKQ